MGMEHGFLETLQGHAAPSGVIIDAIGRQPNSVFQGSEPALTIIPDFFVAGVLTLVSGLLVIIWAIGFIKRKNGVLVLLILSILLFLVGGGLAPLVILVISCAVAAKISKPLKWWSSHLSRKARRFFAELWPWIYIIFYIPSFINLQIAVFGNLFGLKNANLFSILPILILGLLVLSIISGFAYDIQSRDETKKII
jgi:hypothetical protein